jgi:hypothetical protein
MMSLGVINHGMSLSVLYWGSCLPLEEKHCVASGSRWSVVGGLEVQGNLTHGLVP